VIIFGSVWFLSKKYNQTEFFLKKTGIEQKPVETDRFRFGFLRQKPIQIGLARFFRFGLVFLRFFFFGFNSVLYKTQTKTIKSGDLLRQKVEKRHDFKT